MVHGVTYEKNVKKIKKKNWPKVQNKISSSNLHDSNDERFKIWDFEDLLGFLVLDGDESTKDGNSRPLIRVLEPLDTVNVPMDMEDEVFGFLGIWFWQLVPGYEKVAFVFFAPLWSNGWKELSRYKVWEENVDQAPGIDILPLFNHTWRLHQKGLLHSKVHICSGPSDFLDAVAGLPYPGTPNVTFLVFLPF